MLRRVARSLHSRPLLPARTLRRHAQQQRQARLERLLLDVQKSVDRNHNAIDGVRSFTRGVWESDTANGLRKVLYQLLPLLRSVTQAPRYTAGTLLLLATGGYYTRSYIYRKVADESEILGKEVLEANIRNVITTLDGVRSRPRCPCCP